MLLTFLEASTALTKAFSRSSTGVLTKTSYPFVTDVTSHSQTCTSLPNLAKMLTSAANAGWCMLKGEPLRQLVKESRAGSTDRNAATDLLVLDLDGIPSTWTDGAGTTHKVTIDFILDAVGLTDLSYVIQWSASYGIENKHIRAHVFFQLDKPHTAPLLKQWLIQLNLETPLLCACMSLTKTNNAIRWPLDISACQSDKIIYLAPPILKNIPDPMPKGRIQFVKRKRDRLVLPGAINSTAQNRELTTKRLNEIRVTLGLPARKGIYKFHGTTEILIKPDVCTVTEIKQDRGFVYLNLNGGDSWAYYHPETNPDYIYNFKGEPTYLTKELLPDYWESLQGGIRKSSGGTDYLAFCDRNTSTYWRGSYDEKTGALDLKEAKNATMLRDGAKQAGLPIGDAIPEWSIIFDPHSNIRVDQDARVVNLFYPTFYMLNEPKVVKRIPPIIKKVLVNALNDDAEILDHFINWLAFILQYRDRTQTGWVLHGSTGTGKGTLFHKILRPLFGQTQCTNQNMTTLAERWNHWMQHTLIVFVDELQTSALKDEEQVLARVRTYVTEISIQLRAMHRGGHEVRNYTNWIVASNKSDPIKLPAEDRRMNVSRYQPNKLQLTDQELDSIEGELQAFHDYLASYPVDATRARTVLDTEDRRLIISLSESSADTVSRCLNEGNFGWLLEQLPSSTTLTQLNRLLEDKLREYEATLRAILARTDQKTGVCNIARDELRVIYDYAVGGMPVTPNKFTSLLKHHRVYMQDVWINGGKERGIRVVWNDLGAWSEHEKRLTIAPPPPKPKPTLPPNQNPTNRLRRIK